MSTYTVVRVETTELVLALQALPVTASSDSVNVQLRKLAQTEAGRETVRRFADRAVALLAAEPAVRIFPGDPAAAQRRAQPGRRRSRRVWTCRASGGANCWHTCPRGPTPRATTRPTS